jgi:elongation factor P
MHVEVDGTIYRIVDFQHVKPGKGGAFVRTKLKALESASSTRPSGGREMPRIPPGRHPTSTTTAATCT